MTMNPDSPAPIEVPVENLFEQAMRGYNKHQVEDYVIWLQDQVRVAQTEAAEQRRQLALAREELVVSRQQPTATVAPRPHEEISERLGQILRLADEEADGKRAASLAEAEAIVQEARDEAARLLTAADGEAERLLSTARERAAADVEAAEERTRQLVEGSTEVANRTLEDARARASRILSDADRRTASITALQDDRLTQVVGAHNDAVTRLDQIRVLIANLLAEQSAAGAPEAAVESGPLPLAGVPLTVEEAGDTAGHSPPTQPPAHRHALEERADAPADEVEPTDRVVDHATADGDPGESPADDGHTDATDGGSTTTVEAGSGAPTRV